MPVIAAMADAFCACSAPGSGPPIASKTTKSPGLWSTIWPPSSPPPPGAVGRENDTWADEKPSAEP